jgi:predicted MFS family arabinose efflux permease
MTRTRLMREGERRAPPNLMRIVPALGLFQIVAWGSLYYSIAVLADPMAETFGVSRAFVFGAFSASLAVSGLFAPWVGRLIDRHGGRHVLMTGVLTGALALTVIAVAPNPPIFLIGWILAGIAMAATLYDAAFAALTPLAGTRYRRALTVLTLFGGLASTLFWPLSWYLESVAGWRMTLLTFAGLHLLVCLPLLWLALPRAASVRPGPRGTTVGAARPTSAYGTRFLWLATAFSLSAFVFSAIGAHVVAALGAVGLEPGTAIAAAALIGPMQVAGRIAELLVADRVTAIRVGFIALVLIMLSLVLLWLAPGMPWLAFAFALGYGAANGVMTIAKGAVPAELFGRDGYGTIMGRLARPAFLAKAAAPVLISLLLVGGMSYALMPLLLAGLMLLAVMTYGFATVPPIARAREI